ncbi:MAG: hypothetical protein LUC46_10670 [Akkermansia sp.]|nr:hypothetical protein [Akkermansia sp.]
MDAAICGQPDPEHLHSLPDRERRKTPRRPRQSTMQPLGMGGKFNKEKQGALQHPTAWNKLSYSFLQFFGYSAEVLFRCFSQFLLLFPIPRRSFRHPGLFRQPAHGAARVTARFLLNGFQKLRDIFIHGFRVDIISIPMPG